MLNAGQDKKNFHSSNLLCICPSLFDTYPNRAKYSIYEKLSRVFSVAGFHYRDCERKPATSVPSNHFSAALKALVFGNLFRHRIFNRIFNTGKNPIHWVEFWPHSVPIYKKDDQSKVYPASIVSFDLPR